MTGRGSREASGQDQAAVEELVRALAKGQRALQMYLPNNPMFQRAREQMAEAFAPVWSITGRLVLEFEEEDVLWEGAPVYHPAGRQDTFVSRLYQGGLRRLTLLPGVEAEEIVRLLTIFNRARLLSADSSDDLITLLWAEEFILASCTFIEASGDGYSLWESGRIGGGSGGGESGETGGAGSGSPDQRAAQVREEAGQEDAGDTPGTVDLSDYDPTRYFLDEAEHRQIRRELEEEYRRDIGKAALDALLDILEVRRDPEIRKECLSLLEEIIPAQLATGGFRTAGYLISELREIAVRAPALDLETRNAILSFESRLSQPDILQQLIRTLEDGVDHVDQAEVGEVLRELTPAALPTLLSYLGRSLDSRVRRLLEPSVESLARNDPKALVTIIAAEDSVALMPAVELAAKLGLQQLAPVIATRMAHPSAPMRMGAAKALGMLGSPSAIEELEKGLADPDRTVRENVLEILLARGGSSGTLAWLDRMVQQPENELDRSERKVIFEAWGRLVGAGGVARMAELLQPRGFLRRKVSTDLRVCAIFALANIRTLDARLLVEQCTQDPEPVVRSAANAALRGWLE